MAATFDELTTTQWSDHVARVDSAEVEINGTYDALEITCVGNFEAESSLVSAIASAMASDRAAYASMLAGGSLRGWGDPLLFEIAKVINSPEVTPEAIWLDLYDHMHDNTLTCNDPEDTWASVGTVTGTGTGTLVRITLDEQGYKMNGWMPDAYRLECTADARQQGISHEEIFRFTGTDAAPDNGKRTGTGIDETLRCLSERDSERYIQNPGFEVFTGIAPTASTPTVLTTTTQLTGWTASVAANVSATIDYLYRTPPGSTLSYAAQMTDNVALTQDLVAVNGTQIDPDVPYLVRFHIYRESSCDGTLTLALGGVNRAVTMTGLNSGAWNVVDLVATAGANNWPINFNANGLSLSATLASRTTGTLIIDAIIMGPFTQVGGGSGTGRGSMGHWLAQTGGATPHIKGDYYSWTDSHNTRGKVAFWQALAGYGYLPSKTGGTETWSD